MEWGEPTAAATVVSATLGGTATGDITITASGVFSGEPVDNLPVTPSTIQVGETVSVVTADPEEGRTPLQGDTVTLVATKGTLTDTITFTFP